MVQVAEEKPPAGETGVKWTLLTSESIDTAEDILQVVDWHRARWTIEEFFKALKTGCAFERRQLESLHSLTNALAKFLQIAWRLLLLKTLARDEHSLPASTVMTSDELRVLQGLAARRYKFPPEPTARDVYLALAAVGGHIKYNGEPGWITLSRGLDDLLMALRGYQIAKNSDKM